MLILTKIKGKTAAGLFWLLLVISFLTGVYTMATSQEVPTQPRQVNIPVYSIADIQAELVARGWEIKIDGIYGPETENALYGELEAMK